MLSCLALLAVVLLLALAYAAGPDEDVFLPKLKEDGKRVIAETFSVLVKRIMSSSNSSAATCICNAGYSTAGFGSSLVCTGMLTPRLPAPSTPDPTRPLPS